MTQRPTLGGEPAPSTIDADDLVARIEGLSRDQLDELPFGTIRLDAEGRVIYLSKCEATLAGLGERRTVGRHFFTDLAPCMGTPAFLRRLEQARTAGTLDIRFEQVGDFDDAQRELRVRVRSASSDGLWVFIERR